MRLLVEVRRRGILKIATAYLVVSWLTLEIGHTLFMIFELPHAGMQLVFVLLALGLPIALLGAWHGWFAAFTAGAEQPPHSADAHGAHDDEKGHGHHEGPVLAIVFGVVALFAVATAIGMRFFGMTHGGHGSAELESPPAPAAHEPAHTVSESAAPKDAPAAFDPPAHAIAVLPFVNMSGDASQEYFSDGLSEELLNALVRVKNLQVAARTSSFSFKGQKNDIAEIGRKLNVRFVLEGSVRKEGRRVRITAQLINAVTGFHLWSDTYDRDLKDVLQLQTDIATAVTSASQATLLGNEASLIEVGGTKNPQAFDLYLRAQSKLQSGEPPGERERARIAGLTAAIQLDPQFAKAYVGRAVAAMELAGGFDVGQQVRKRYAEARADAEKAIELAPSLPTAHTAMARVLTSGYLDLQGADASLRRALALAPGDVDVLVAYSSFASNLGHHDEAIAAARRAAALDPLTATRYRRLAQTLIDARQYSQAVEAINRGIVLNPKLVQSAATLCYAQYAMGRLEAARQTCMRDPQDWWARTLLAVTLHKLNRQDEARDVLAKLVAELGVDASFQYAEIYAQWGDIPKALDALDAAYRARDPGLTLIKTDMLLDPIRDEPRYRELLRKLNFPP